MTSKQKTQKDHECPKYENLACCLRVERNRLEAKNARLRERAGKLVEALRMCADPSTWHAPCLRCGPSVIGVGSNYFARKAIAEWESSEEKGK